MGRAIRSGKYRSRFEAAVAKRLKESGRVFRYEPEQLRYEHKNGSSHFYKPDFVLEDGSIVEAKGELTKADREKLVAVKQQHPGRFISFVFQDGGKTVQRGGKKTYREWAVEQGFGVLDVE